MIHQNKRLIKNLVVLSTYRMTMFASWSIMEEMDNYTKRRTLFLCGVTELESHPWNIHDKTNINILKVQLNMHPIGGDQMNIPLCSHDRKNIFHTVTLNAFHDKAICGSMHAVTALRIFALFVFFLHFGHLHMHNITWAYTQEYPAKWYL